VQEIDKPKLIVSVTNNEPNENVADAFHSLGIQTKHDNTNFLAKSAKLMFGPLQSCCLGGP